MVIKVNNSDFIYRLVFKAPGVGFSLKVGQEFFTVPEKLVALKYYNV